MYLLTHSLSPVLVLVVVMGSMELKTSRSHSDSITDSPSVTLYLSLTGSLTVILLPSKAAWLFDLTKKF